MFYGIVSILVLMEVPLQHHYGRYGRIPRNGVSILVLMEVPLQPLNCTYINESELGFNPCFNGSSSSTLLIVIIYNIIIHVSILVLMEVPLQQRNDPRKNRG